MGDYLMRDAAPLAGDVWRAVDEMVATVISKNLVARRVLSLVGPLGWGVDVVPVIGFEQEGEAYITAEMPGYQPLQALEARFMLRMKDLARAEQTPFALDLGAVATAATELARKEDGLLIGGLIEQATVGDMGDWTQINKPFEAVAKAEAALRTAGFDGPFALVLGFGTYAQLASLMSHGQRELKLVKSLVEAGIHRSPVVPEGQALLIDPAPWNVDMVVGQDAATAFLGNEGLNLSFQIMETLALRIKRSGAAMLLR